MKSKKYNEMLYHIDNILKIIETNKIGKDLVNDIYNIKNQIKIKK